MEGTLSLVEILRRASYTPSKSWRCPKDSREERSRKLVFIRIAARLEEVLEMKRSRHLSEWMFDRVPTNVLEAVYRFSQPSSDLPSTR